MKFPEMRLNLKVTVEFLSDPVSMIEDMNRHDPPHYYDFDECVHFLFDDTELATEPLESVGFFLFNDEEAHLVYEVVLAVDRLLERYDDCDLSQDEYISKPEWADVSATAKMALKVIEQNDQNNDQTS